MVDAQTVVDEFQLPKQACLEVSMDLEPVGRSVFAAAASRSPRQGDQPVGEILRSIDAATPRRGRPAVADSLSKSL